MADDSVKIFSDIVFGYEEVASDRGTVWCFLCFGCFHPKENGRDNRVRTVRLYCRKRGMYHMTQVDKNIATNLKRIRKNKSLDMMAEKTGVSKSMLGQIERGESNPTVATISKIVEGLKISFEELLYVKSEELLLVDDNQISPYREKDGKYQIKVLFPYDRNRQFEMFSIRIEPGQVCGKISEDEGTCEYITVLSGEALVRFGNREQVVKTGQNMRLVSGLEHCYCNKGQNPLLMNLTLSYENEH